MSGGEFSKATVALIVRRDGNCCALCGGAISGERGFDWSVHHRCPRGQGGTSLGWVGSAANGLLLHGHGTAGCHGEVERDRERAARDGFLLSRLGRATALVIPVRHAVHGWVVLDAAGGMERVPESLAVELLVQFGLRSWGEVA